MSHFFAEATGDTVGLTKEDYAHAVKSLRLREGEPITLAVGGQKYAALFREDNHYTLAAPLPSPEPTIRTTLFQGLPKGDKMETVVQWNTQGGISRVVPVLFRRCVAQWDAKTIPRKTERLQKIALEAAMQSGRCQVPEIGSPIRWADIPVADYDAVFLPWEESARQGVEGLKSRWLAAKEPPRSVAFIIGPEGGIDGDEAAALMAKGAVPISLGRRIFRTESAGFAALCALLTLSGDLEG